MKTWTIVTRPKGKPVISNRYIFKVKKNQEGKIERFKARLVARGYTQTFGVDYHETFAPVLRAESLRFIIIYAASKNLILYKLDVETAFLQGDLNEEVYMEIPEGYQINKDNNNKDNNINNNNNNKDNNINEFVCKLNKSLYGLKQASRNWNEKLSNIIKNINFIQSRADPCIYIKYDDNNNVDQLIGIIVDDFIGCGNNFDETKKYLKDKLKIKDLGVLESFVGIKIDQTKESIILSQSKYIEDVLTKFNMLFCSPAPTPLPLKLETDTAECLTKFENINLYQQGIGSLIYLSNTSRPDIIYAVNLLARKLVNPSVYDFQLFKRILRYLKGTINYNIEYQKIDFNIRGYSDASYAEEIGRKSSSGYIYMVNNSPVIWKSHKQSIVALSSMESEYIGLANCIKEDNGYWYY
jgi:hypothetical protein